MTLDELHSMAGRWRLALEGGALSTTQALDAAAAIAESDDWRDLARWCRRLGRARFDRAAAGRVSRRLAIRYRIAATPEALLAALGRATLDDPDPGRGTARLIVTTDDSGAGSLKGARIADRVIAIDRGESLVRGPVPPGDDPRSFFDHREAAWDADPSLGPLPEWLRADASFEAWCNVVADCEDHARVEWWIGPDVNDQLLALRALAWPAMRRALAPKLWLMQADVPLGEMPPASFASSAAALVKIDDRVLRTATRAWNAYCASTPESWSALLGADLGALPRLTETIGRLLGELPAPNTALGSTQRRVLERIDAQPTCFVDLADWNGQHDPHRVYRYWDFGALVADLAAGDDPIVVGLPPGPFDLALHDDAARHREYLRSPLSLSPLGRALRTGRTDLAAHRPIDRWWGGTHLTNERLWRWDAAGGALIAPSSR